jgi:transposase
MGQVKTIAVDLAKSVFHLYGVDERGRAVFRKRLTRGKFQAFMAKHPPCVVFMEACGSAHHWARECARWGHEAKLIAPRFVKPYVKSNKNDHNDAEGIYEAGTRPTMRFVAVKSVAQQDIQALHRVRERIKRARTALSNEMRGLLAEYGIVLPRGVSALRRGLPEILEDGENGLTGRGRELFAALYEELVAVDERLAVYNRHIETVYREQPCCQRLAKVEGVGPLNATAAVATVADAGVFKNGRQMAAWLGLVPRQHSTGGKTVLRGISKRGDRYLRSLLVHGARSVVKAAAGKSDARSQWINQLRERRGYNKAAVAVANKNARILWALMMREEEYRPAT